MDTGSGQPGNVSIIPRIAFLVLVALKLGTLAWFGPTMAPDSGGYIAYANAILDGSFRHVDLQQNPMSLLVVREIGFPAIIAAAMKLTGQYWRVTVILLQFVASLLATSLVYRLCRSLRLGMWVSIAVTAAQATSIQFVIDQAILTDSLQGSTIAIAACVMSLAILRRQPVSLIAFVGIGALFALGFLMKPVTEFMMLGFVPLSAAAASVERSRLRTAIAFCLVFMPVMATHFAYVEWNRLRIGAPVVTTVSQAALLEALVEASRYDPSVFAGSTPIDVAARQVKPIPGAETEIGAILNRDNGWDTVRISHEATVAYLQAWLNHPWPMIRHTLNALSETQLHQAVRPTETIRDVLLWNTGSDHEFARYRPVRHGNWWMIPAVIAHRLAETISILVFCAFLVITPVRSLSEGLCAETNVLIGLWFSYLFVGSMYCAVAFEPRYLAPVVANAIVAGAANIAWLLSWYRRRLFVGIAPAMLSSAQPPDPIR